MTGPTTQRGAASVTPPLGHPLDWIEDLTRQQREESARAADRVIQVVEKADHWERNSGSAFAQIRQALRGEPPPSRHNAGWVLRIIESIDEYRLEAQPEPLPWLATLEPPVVSWPTAASPARERFRRLADEWVADTAASSVIEDMVLHPAYQQIIGMGPPAIPLLLEELGLRPNYWFWALAAIAGEDAGANATDFDDAVSRWLEWGRLRNTETAVASERL